MTKYSRHIGGISRALFLVVTGSVLIVSVDAAAAVDVSVQAAETASIPIVLRDQRFRMTCDVAEVQMGADGALMLEDSTCGNLMMPGSTGSLKFVAGGQTTHSCEFGGMTMDALGNMSIYATGDCLTDSDQDKIPDFLDPLVEDKATGECLVQGQAPDETVNLSGANYAADATCALPSPNRLVAANTQVGAVDTPAVVDFHAKDSIDILGAAVDGSSSFNLRGNDQGNPVVRLWGPFYVKSGGIFTVHASSIQ